MSAPTPTPDPAPRRGSFAWQLPAAGLAVLILLVVYPPVRIVSRSAPPAATGSAAPVVFDPAAFTGEFWSGRLLPAAASAPDAGPIIAAVQADPAAATRTHAHRVGLGSAAYYFARGTGRVTAVERSRLLVDIGGATVAVRTGPVFGNAIRDGSGLLEVNQAPGLAEFNAVSAELNRLVEERVQPRLRDAVVGATLVFAGCAEAPETLPSTGPLLTFIPVQAELQP